jgi:UDP-glucose 4-epimerase
MKILVTGGAGFIGSHVADAYLQEGHEVAVLDNLSTGFRRNVPTKAVFFETDILDSEGVFRVFEEFQPEIVNHHAAQMDVRRSLIEPEFDARTNILGSLHLILASVSYAVKKFIYISTCGAVYGEPKSLPVREDHPVNPECAYGISKHTVEHYLHLYRFLEGLDYTVLRYPNVYGPRQNPKGEAGVNAIFIDQMLEGTIPTIYGDGEQLRDYVYVGDIVAANVAALTRGSGEIVNIGSGTGVSVNQIVTVLARLLDFRESPKYAPARAGEIYKIYLDPTHAKEILGWKAQVPFEEGLRRTIEWHRKRRVGAVA